MRALLERARASRPLWVGALDVLSTLLLIQYLVSGRDHASFGLVAALVWLVFVTAITVPEIRRVRRERRAAAQPAEPGILPGPSRQP